jgi:hypothetical protein
MYAYVGMSKDDSWGAIVLYLVYICRLVASDSLRGESCLGGQSQLHRFPQLKETGSITYREWLPPAQSMCLGFMVRPQQGLVADACAGHLGSLQPCQIFVGVGTISFSRVRVLKLAHGIHGVGDTLTKHHTTGPLLALSKFSNFNVSKGMQQTTTPG